MTERDFAPERAGLYAILDVDAWRARHVELATEGTLESIADALLAARPVALQLRAKHEHARDTLALAARLQPRAHRAGVPFVVNDRLDFALLSDADLLHVGQDDLPLTAIRAVAPALPVGVSTHDLPQLRAALASPARPHYLAFGPVFGTTSKHRPDPTTGLEAFLAAAAEARAADLVCVAIGGIDRARAARIAAHTPFVGAVISALVAVDASGRPDLDAVTAEARALDALMRGRPAVGAAHGLDA
jgi:thiamine-phosphate pyrophosphorylase